MLEAEIVCLTDFLMIFMSDSFGCTTHMMDVCIKCVYVGGGDESAANLFPEAPHTQKIQYCAS